MRKNIISIIMLLGLVAIPTPSNAQFLKSLGKALENAGKEVLQGSTGQQGVSVKFSNLRLTYDQKDASNGRTMLQLHYSLTAVGLLNHKLVPVLAIEKPKETFHKFADGNDMKQVGNELLCNYQSTTFNGQWQAIYVDALNPLPGKQTYYACIYVVDKTTNQLIAKSDYMTFTNTGAQQSSKGQEQRSQQQARQQQPKTQHMEFQGISMGQPAEEILAKLKAKGFTFDANNGILGTIDGMPVRITIDNDGSIIRVSELKAYPRAQTKNRYQKLITSLKEAYHGKAHSMVTWEDSEGSIISTDKGYIEILYRDDDELNSSGIEYVCDYVYKDKASMSKVDILEEEAYNVGDVVSAETAIALYQFKDEDATREVLGNLGYVYATKDTQGYQYWCKNCKLANLKPTAFTKGVSSVVRLRFQGQPDIRVRVFNEKATQSFYDQMEKLGYGWQGTGTGTGALEWKKDMTDQKEKSIWLISEKGYFYQQYGGYYLIIGGSL